VNGKIAENWGEEDSMGYYNRWAECPPNHRATLCPRLIHPEPEVSARLLPWPVTLTLACAPSLVVFSAAAALAHAPASCHGRPSTKATVSAAANASPAPVASML
jgi:hypothetical protein